MFPFHINCPEPGLREIRSIHVLAPGGQVPVGEYAYLELYCQDLDCDCRRVLFQVASSAAPDTILATINFGWESIEFYTEWMHGDEEAGREIVNASLDPMNPQSEYSDHLLDLFQNVMMADPNYVARLRAHYELFKRSLRARPWVNASRPGRNEPCPCGSGKKYKKCCGSN